MYEITGLQVMKTSTFKFSPYRVVHFLKKSVALKGANFSPVQIVLFSLVLLLFPLSVFLLCQACGGLIDWRKERRTYRRMEEGEETTARETTALGAAPTTTRTGTRPRPPPNFGEKRKL